MGVAFKFLLAFASNFLKIMSVLVAAQKYFYSKTYFEVDCVLLYLANLGIRWHPVNVNFAHWLAGLIAHDFLGSSDVVEQLHPLFFELTQSGDVCSDLVLDFHKGHFILAGIVIVSTQVASELSALTVVFLNILGDFVQISFFFLDHGAIKIFDVTKDSLQARLSQIVDADHLPQFKESVETLIGDVIDFLLKTIPKKMSGS